MTTSPRSEQPRGLAGVPTLTISITGIPPIGQGAISGGGTRTSKTGKTYRQPGYHSNKAGLEPWRDAVQFNAQLAMRRDGWTTVAKPAAVELSATFYLPRPKSVSIAARPYPTVTAPGVFDNSHLVRAIEDALTKARVWEDDSQIIDFADVGKRYADHRPPGAVITVRLVED